MTTTKLPSGSRRDKIVTSKETELWAGGNGSGLEIEHPLERTLVPPPPIQTLPAGGDSGAGAPAPSADSAPKVIGRTKVARFHKGTISSSELGTADTALRDRLLASYGLDAEQLVRLSYNQKAFDRKLNAASRRVADRLEPDGADYDAADRQAFALVATALGQWGGPMPATLRGALFRFASTLGGISVTEASSPSSRHATKFTLGDSAILLGPDDHKLVGTSFTSSDLETTVEVLDSRVVGSVPKPPPSS